MIRFSLSRIFDLENYWNWVGKKEPISAELYDNSGRTIFLPLENEMKRERCLVRSQHASRSCSRRVFLFSQRNVFLVNKKTQIELVGLVSTISICRLIVCFLSERSWSLCTHTWNCPYRMYRLFSFVWPFSRFYSKRLPLFVFFFVLSSKLLLWLLLLLNIARSTDDGHENLTHAPNECVWNENKLEMKIEENPGTFSRHDQSLNYF